MKYRIDLEVYRGIAILSIYFYHCKYINLCGGYIGVDFFFILSGYLVINRITQVKEKCNSFLYKKLLRLLPSAYLVLFFLCYYYNNIYTNNPIILLNDIKSALLFYANIHFYFQNKNYFYKGEDTSIILHYWYLAVEIQFCFVIAFSLYIVSYIRNVVFILLFCFSFIFNFIFSLKYSSYCYLSTFSRLWQFFIFIFKIKYASYNKFCSISAYTIIFALLFLYDSNMNYPGYFAILPSILFYYIISDSNISHHIISRFLEKIGNVSYPFYLIHFILLRIYGINFLSEIYLLCCIIIFSSLWCACYDKYFKKPNNINTYIFMLIILLALYFIEFINVNIKKINKGLLYSNNIHPKLFLGLSPLLKIIKKEKCIINYNSNLNYILLIGDSHMSQWLPLLLTTLNNSRVLILFKWTHRSNIIKNNSIYFHDIVEKVKKIKIKYIILSFYTTKLVQNNIESNLIHIINLLRIKTNEIFLIEDNPSHQSNPAYCLRNRKNKYCYGILNSNTSFYRYSILQGILGYKYITFSKYYKVKNKFPFIYNNILIYVDDNHLSVDFSVYLSRFAYHIFKLSKQSRYYNICRLYYL